MDGITCVDPRFNAFVLPNAPLEKLADGFRWLEGPVWFADRQCLLASDLPNDRIVRWTPSGGVSVFRQPAGFANGHTRDREGRLIGCSHGERCIQRTELDGTVTVLVDRYQGKPLNSPNDVVVKRDGTIWFSDPPYGISSDYEGGKRVSELPANLWSSAGDGVHCISPAAELLGKIAVPSAVANLCFGGRARSRLFICGSHTLYAIYVNQRGAQRP